MQVYKCFRKSVGVEGVRVVTPTVCGWHATKVDVEPRCTYVSSTPKLLAELRAVEGCVASGRIDDLATRCPTVLGGLDLVVEGHDEVGVLVYDLSHITRGPDTLEDNNAKTAGTGEPPGPLDALLDTSLVFGPEKIAKLEALCPEPSVTWVKRHDLFEPVILRVETEDLVLHT